ncbi:MAG: hypothetical protein COT25_04860 [Candidatus Kerfeldbacteria bacterium CG08_land_8_20_14_0_20_42_7]|uniref:General secretion pathway GspH domain-containing protein n=1 Tax=Candidatus Kerfeldbacteria bacterium CG08_land_8_20_14_0_20_42_7 TaxID=2014245 RepID=A0A2H0YTN3_9BACT|nr:MAG: hypothetical protein COT25_04860 [Candidatus Kerfeldbacteria bacterium CG08_land_8_20_14_0_20_42_7]
MYVSWSQTAHHGTAVTAVVDLIQKAERNALASVEGTDWILEQTSANSVTLRNSSSTISETIMLPNDATMDWNSKTSYIFSTPRGLTDETGSITIQTAEKATDIVIRSNGTLDVSSTAL